MKTLLLCPAQRPAVAALAAHLPLVLVPVLGRSLLDWHLAAEFATGCRELRVAAADRPELVRGFLGGGERWGLKAELLPTAAEPLAGAGERLVDRLPGAAAGAFESYKAWFDTVRAALANGAGQRVGMREVAPGAWVHLRAKVDPEARLTGPCWVGANVQVKAHAQVGPDAYVEDDSVIEHGAALHSSWVGPRTHVGAFTELTESLAWGRTLCKWSSGASTEVADAFLLSELRVVAGRRAGSAGGRLLALCAALASAPLAAVALVVGICRGGRLLEWRDAVLPDGAAVAYANFTVFRGCLRRWPWLLAIARGHFAWFGNPPLSRAQAAELQGEFEQLWTSVAPGLLSLPEALGCDAAPDDEARTHAGYYAACRSRALDATIVKLMFGRARTALRAMIPARNSSKHEHFCLRSGAPGERRHGA